MARYPDILNNPDGDPRIYQQQYEDWYREQEGYEKEKHQQSQDLIANVPHDRHIKCPVDAVVRRFYMSLNQYLSLNLVGDIKLSPSASEEDCNKILFELEKFMIKHGIDKIDIGWSRSGLLKS